MIYNVPVWDMTGAHKKSITISWELKYYFERERVVDRANLSAERRCSWGCDVSEYIIARSEGTAGWYSVTESVTVLLIVTSSEPVTPSHHNSGGTLYKTTNLRTIKIMMGDTVTYNIDRLSIIHWHHWQYSDQIWLCLKDVARCGVICVWGWQVVSVWLGRYEVCKWWCLMYSERDSRDNIPVTPVTTLPGTHLALSTLTALSRDPASQSEPRLTVRTNEKWGSLTYEWQWL